MKVIEHLEKAKDPLFSYEIVPPPRGRSLSDIVEIVEALEPFRPPWIDVTSHAASAYYRERADGTVDRRIYKKRPGTIGICGIIQNRFKIDTVTHLLTKGFTKEETEDALIELNYLGIHNILALRGDGPNYKKSYDKSRSVNNYASDLVGQINDLNDGKFLDDIANPGLMDFGIGVAGYPEKHFEAPNLQMDIHYLKQKVEKGADYIATQMFFDNQRFFHFVEKCREAGITAPIIPGIKILKSAKQLQSIPRHFHIDFPDDLVAEVLESPKNAKDIGMEWATKQCQELLDFGVPCLHFYIMNDTDSVIKLVKKFY